MGEIKEHFETGKTLITRYCRYELGKKVIHPSTEWTFVTAVTIERPDMSDLQGRIQGFHQYIVFTQPFSKIMDFAVNDVNSREVPLSIRNFSINFRVLVLESELCF